ncbi:GerAB/ArcD/ProY family transporter [Aciduricibacillus chroicocephali]|uniref:GerAB/ArcD/ProY family transporter n=1 Tax=Aciduricibacillus chroicocephali TaxID=3054939 RepID=A0ABY9KYA4_9BACI|nr:GerAB/ArcD/ProY family transporter [Bacillaceae bacterium 44XB]
MKPTNVIGLREFVSMGAIIVGLKLTDDTPVVYYKSLANSAWMAPLISGVIVGVLIYLTMNTLDRYEGQNLIDVIYIGFGKIIGWIVVMYLFISLYLSLIIDSAIYSDLISTMYFINTPVVAIYGLIVILCSIGAMMGIGAISSLAWSIIVYLKFFLFIALVLAFGHGQTSFIYPLFGYGEWDVIKESISSISLLDEFFYFCIFATLLPTKKDFRKGMWIMLIMVTIEITLSMIAFITVFDYKSAQLLNYPWHEVIRYISLGFIKNVESLFFPFWLIGLIIRFSFYFYVTAYLLGRLFKINKFQLIVPILAVLTVFIGMIPEQPSFALPELRKSFINLLSLPTISITILLWGVVKFKKRRETKRDN